MYLNHLQTNKTITNNLKLSINYINTKETTIKMLTDLLTYDVSNLSHKIEAGEFKDGDKIVKYYRVKAQTRYPNNTYGDLIFSTGRIFSFGVSKNENKDAKGNTNVSYSMALSMWDKDSPTDEQKLLTTKISEIIEKTKDFVLLKENLAKIKGGSMTRAHIDSFDNSIVWKKDEDGNKIKTVGPSMYPKFLERRARAAVDDKKAVDYAILSKLYNENEIIDDEMVEVNPLEMVGKFCTGDFAIKYEGAFIGSLAKTTQFKLWEANITPLDNTRKRLLTHKPAVSERLEFTSSKPVEEEEPEPTEELDDEPEPTEEIFIEAPAIEPVVVKKKKKVVSKE